MHPTEQLQRAHAEYHRARGEQQKEREQNPAEERRHLLVEMV